jgi:hypothetical protein
LRIFERIDFAGESGTSSSSTSAFKMGCIDWLLNGECMAAGLGFEDHSIIDWRNGYGLPEQGDPDLLAVLLSAVSPRQPLNSDSRDQRASLFVGDPARVLDPRAWAPAGRVAEFDALVEHLVDYWLRRGSELLLG